MWHRMAHEELAVATQELEVRSAFSDTFWGIRRTLFACSFQLVGPLA